MSDHTPFDGQYAELIDKIKHYAYQNSAYWNATNGTVISHNLVAGAGRTLKITLEFLSDK